MKWPTKQCLLAEFSAIQFNMPLSWIILCSVKLKIDKEKQVGTGEKRLLQKKIRLVDRTIRLVDRRDMYILRQEPYVQAQLKNLHLPFFYFIFLCTIHCSFKVKWPLVTVKHQQLSFLFYTNYGYGGKLSINNVTKSRIREPASYGFPDASKLAQ